MSSETPDDAAPTPGSADARRRMRTSGLPGCSHRVASAVSLGDRAISGAVDRRAGDRGRLDAGLAAGDGRSRCRRDQCRRHRCALVRVVAGLEAKGSRNPPRGAIPRGRADRRAGKIAGGLRDESPAPARAVRKSSQPTSRRSNRRRRVVACAGASDLTAINGRLAEVERARSRRERAQREGREPTGGRRRRCAASGRGVAARSLGAARRAVRRSAEGREVAGLRSADARSRWRGSPATGVPNPAQPQPRTADAGAETDAAGRKCRQPAPASSIACRRARQNWSASSAPMPSAPTAAPSSRGSPQRRCATMFTRRGAN